MSIVTTEELQAFMGLAAVPTGGAELDDQQESGATATAFAEEIGKSSGGFFVATVGVNGTTVTIVAA